MRLSVILMGAYARSGQPLACRTMLEGGDNANPSFEGLFHGGYGQLVCRLAGPVFET